MHSATGWRAACLAGCALLTACGSSGRAPAAPTPSGIRLAAIPAAEVFVSYAPRNGGFSLRYPKGWRQQDVQGATTFSDGYNEISVTTSTQRTAPTTGSVRSNYLVALRPLLGFKLGTVDTVSRPAGQAVRIVYQATSVPDRFTGQRVPLDNERYLFWRNGQLLVLTVSTPHGIDNARAWQTVTDSLAWK